MKTSSGVILAMAGVGVIYLGITGYWRSFWTGLQGGYVKPPDDANDVPDEGDVKTQSTGRGGEAATNFNQFDGGKGSYYSAPTGLLMRSDQGAF